MVVQDVRPVDHGPVQDDLRDAVPVGGVDEGLQHDRPAHRPPHEHDVAGAVLQGVGDGGVHVTPLGQPEAVEPVVGGGRHLVVAGASRAQPTAEFGADPEAQLATMDEDWARLAYRQPAPTAQSEESGR